MKEMRMYLIILITSFVFWATLSSSSSVAELPRTAYLGVDLRAPRTSQIGAEVIRIVDPQVASGTGLQKGDRILRINDTPLDRDSFERIVPALRAGNVVRFVVARKSTMVTLSAKLAPLPKEHIEGLDIDYGSVIVSDRGFRVRVIVSRPHGASAPLPAIFLTGWLSCDSVEYPFGPGDDGFGQLLYDVAKQSGFVLVRTEKPGVGDSEGPPCSDADFSVELDSYRASFQALKNLAFVDPDRVFVLGLSNGAGFAPLVAPAERSLHVRGYVIAGAWVKTWFEHMIELERRRLMFTGKSQGEIDSLMSGYASFYSSYLIDKKTPRQVLLERPQLSSLWYDEPERQYGRPASYYQQLQQLNLAAAWEQVNSPTLIFHGEYDWIMSRSDHEMIASLVNRNGSSRATFVELPQTNHLLMKYNSPQAAFRGGSDGIYNKSVTELALSFFQKNASAK